MEYPIAPLIILVAMLTVSCASSEPTRSEVEQAKLEKVSLDHKDLASKQLQTLFEPLDPKSLEGFRNSRDQTIRLHATWELAKGDAVKTQEFIREFEAVAKVAPPIWWQRCVKSIRVYENNCHYVPSVVPREDDKEEQLSHGKYTISCIPGVAGFSYTVTARHKDASIEEVKMEVWAVGRTLLAGAGAHQVELLANDGKLYVFGAESHGVYAEVFSLSDGKPLLKFSSCYWFNFSESWEKASEN